MAFSRIMKYCGSSHSLSGWLYCKKPLLHSSVFTQSLRFSRVREMQDPGEGLFFYSPLFSFLVSSFGTPLAFLLGSEDKESILKVFSLFKRVFKKEGQDLDDGIFCVPVSSGI